MIDTDEDPSTSHGFNKPGQAKTTLSLIALPDDVICEILQQSSHRSLLKLSLVCRSLNELARPFLFRHLDLSSRPLPDLSRMCNELFRGSAPGKQGPLQGMHIKTLTYSLVEILADDKEFAEGVGVLLKSLNSAQSIARLSLGITPSVEDSTSLHPNLVCALRHILQSCLGKVKEHKVCLDGRYPDYLPKAIATGKVSEVLELYSNHTVVSLQFSDIHVADMPARLQIRLNRGALRELSLQRSSGLWAPALHTLRFSWERHSSESTGFETALRMIKASAGSLRVLALQNELADIIALPEASFPEELANLQCLDITDVGIGAQSILGYMLAYTKLPNLQLLRLKLEDIISLDCDVSTVLERLPHIKNIILSEISKVRLNRPDISNSTYKTLEAQCLQRGISLQTHYTSPRCDSNEDFEYEWARITLLSGTLSHLDKRVQPNTLGRMHSIPPIQLPFVQNVSVAFGSIRYTINLNGECREDSCRVPLLYHLLERIDALNVLKLKIMCFIDDKSAGDILQALTEALRKKLFPRLEELSGEIPATLATSSETAWEFERDLREACRLVGIDCEALKVIGAKETLREMIVNKLFR